MTVRKPGASFNPGKTNALINSTAKVAKPVGKVFVVIMVADELNKIRTSDDWARQLGSSSSGMLGSIGGGMLGGAAGGAGMGALTMNPFAVAGGAIAGGIVGGYAGYYFASGAFEYIYDLEKSALNP